MNPRRKRGGSRKPAVAGSVRIGIENQQAGYVCDPGRIRKLVRCVLQAHEVSGPGQVTICLVDDRVITGLHARFLGARGPTDVISFKLSGEKKGEPLVADIAVSVDTAMRQAGQFGTSLDYEVHLYVVHGLLHALGYDDSTGPAQERMQKKCEFFLDRQRIYKCPSIRPKR